MSYLKVSLCFLICVITESSAKPNIQSRILGGGNAGTTEIPYQVSLRTSDMLVGKVLNSVLPIVVGSSGHFCGGSIIATTRIVTSAHCVYNVEIVLLDLLNELLLVGPILGPILAPFLLSPFVAVVGSRLLSSGGTEISINSYKVHPGYDPNTFINDIAVIRLQRDMYYTSSIRPIPLPPVNSVFSEDSAATVSGWGRTQVCY